MIKLLMIASLIVAIFTLVVSAVKLFKENNRDYTINVIVYSILILILIFVISDL